MKNNQIEPVVTDFVEMGYIAAPFGIKGWVKAKLGVAYTNSLEDYEYVYLRSPKGEIKSYKIDEYFVRDDVFHLKFSDSSTRETALLLKGYTLLVERSNFPKLENDEYYWVDLIGLTVVNLQNEALGTVKSLMETGANDVMVVVDGTEQRLIPFVATYINKVDMLNKQIIVDWGLDY